MHSMDKQGFMFCAPCDLWDSLPPDTSKKNSINSRRFECKANHIYFSHPTTLKRESCFEQRKRTVTQQHAVPPTAVELVEANTDVAQQLDDGDLINRGRKQR